MDNLQDVLSWFVDHPLRFSILKFFIWLTLIYSVFVFLRKLVKNSFPDSKVRYRTQKVLEVVLYSFIVLLAVFYFTGNIKDFTLAIGLLSAGITITLQELILSVAGSFYIFFVGVYKPGDRIEINGIKGDVIDIDSVYTTMMEIGQWVKSDNYSGRIVKLSNSFVFKGPVYNYSRDFPFVWDELELPIHYNSDLEKANEIILGIASEFLSEYVKESLKGWKQVVEKYYIEDAQVHPSVAVTLTDNWAQFSLRYIVDYKKRRWVKNQLYQKLLSAINGSQGKVKLASTTFEILSFPDVRISNDLINKKEGN